MATWIVGPDGTWHIPFGPHHEVTVSKFGDVNHIRGRGLFPGLSGPRWDGKPRIQKNREAGETSEDDGVRDLSIPLVTITHPDGTSFLFSKLGVKIIFSDLQLQPENRQADCPKEEGGQ